MTTSALGRGRSTWTSHGPMESTASRQHPCPIGDWSLSLAGARWATEGPLAVVPSSAFTRLRLSSSTESTCGGPTPVPEGCPSTRPWEKAVADHPSASLKGGGLGASGATAHLLVMETNSTLSDLEPLMNRGPGRVPRGAGHDHPPLAH